MQENQRLFYLKALGIQTWAPKYSQVNTELVNIEHDIELLAIQTTKENSEAKRIAMIKQLVWEDLAIEVARCTACPLHKTRTRPVFGVGSRTADLLIIGEAPGANEDKQGEPFVGRAGQLLNAMLQAIGLKREQIYIANILKSRPPNNRDPKPEEVQACTPFLLRQIELLKPKLILAVGRIAAQYLLNTTNTMTSLRGREFTYSAEQIPLLVTYHPAYLLRSPREKAKAWDDMQLVAQRLTEIKK